MLTVGPVAPESPEVILVASSASGVTYQSHPAVPKDQSRFTFKEP
jgi:hypothetical protein